MHQETPSQDLWRVLTIFFDYYVFPEIIRRDE
jgi:hypothetical protein